MYCREKPSREEKYKPRKGHRNTASFSSSLLDEIYRSIDAAGNAERVKDEHVARPCLVEKWMMEKETNKIDHPRRSTRQSAQVSPELKTKKKDEDDLIKSRSKAYKVYARLKKMKQPISPGGKLTNFLNSLFNSTPNKSKKQNHTIISTNKAFHQDLKPNINSKVSFSSSSSSSNCSSFSRSCPSRYSSESGERKMRVINEPERRVGFHPTAVIYGGDSKPPLPPNANALISSLREKNREKNRDALNVFKSNQNQRRSDFAMHHHYEEDEDDDDDGISDSSSDLFELDHLASFSEELPVYGTTYYNNRDHRVVNALYR